MKFSRIGGTLEKTRKLAIEPLYLGFSAVISTLLIYEPALHSFVKFEHFDEFITPFSLAAFAACAVAAALCIALARHPSSKERAWRKIEDALLVASTAVGAVGFLLLVAFEGVLPLQIAAGAFAGAAAALVLLAWGRAYAGCSMQKALLHIALSCVIAVLLMNTMGTLPFPITAILFCFLSAAGAILPIAWNRQRSGGREPGHNAEEPEDSQKHVQRDGKPATMPKPMRRMLGNLVEPLVGIFLFSLVFATLGDHHVYLFYLSFLMGTLLSGLCIIPLLYVNSRRPILSLIYQVILPVLGLVLLVIAMIVPGGPQDMIARNGSMLFYAFASMLFCASVVGFATADEFKPDLILGSAIATFAFGGFIGTALANTVGRNEYITGIFLALTCIYVIFLAIRPSISSWLGKEANLFGTPSLDTGNDSEATCLVIADKFALTDREKEILSYVVAGHTSSYIARTLFISESTVRGHIHHIYQKLGISSREEMVELFKASA